MTNLLAWLLARRRQPARIGHLWRLCRRGHAVPGESSWCAHCEAGEHASHAPGECESCDYDRAAGVA